MTARSFTEAFAKARTDDDILADIDTWHRWNAGSPLDESYPTTSDAQNALARVLDVVPSLLGRVRWAVTLEGQNAEIDRLCKTWEADEQEHLNTFGQHLPCSLAVPAEQLRAALTGSTE